MRDLRLFSSEKRRTMRNLINLSNFLKDGVKARYFIVRVMKHWERLSRDVVVCPSLEIFKAIWIPSKTP